MINKSFNKIIYLNRSDIIWIITLLGITLTAYYSTVYNKFTNWDDIQQVIGNEDIKILSFNNIKKIFSSYYVGMYQPIPTLLYTIIFSIFKLEAIYYHLLSLFIHCINIVLVYALIKIISQQKEFPIIVAALFAINPLQVEAVAWISALSTIVYSCFYILSLLYYIFYLKTNNKRIYWLLSFLFFIIALLSKSAAVTLPVLFFLFDYYYDKRFNKKSVLDKIPFLILSIIFGIITIIARRQSSQIIDLSTQFNFIDRIFLFTHSLFTYVYKLFIPINLSAFHPYPIKKSVFLPFLYYLSVIFIILIIYGLHKNKKNRKELILGCLFFLITILIMMEIIPVGLQVIKERYTYISCIGIYFSFCVFLFSFLNTNKLKQAVFNIIIIILIFSFTWLTYSRVKIWENSFTLWNSVIKKNPSISAAYINRGNAFSMQGDFASAINDYSIAINIEPHAADAFIDRAIIYTKLEKYNEALSDYNNAIDIGHVDYNTFVSRGLIKSVLNDFDGAIKDLSNAILMNPNDEILYNQRGIFYGMTSQYLLALSDFKKAISINCNYIEAYTNKGNAELKLNQFNEALSDFNKSISLNSKLGITYYYRAKVNVKLNLFKEACNDYKAAYTLGINEAQNEIYYYCK